MVLKRSRFCANTGSTQRKCPFSKRQCARGNDLITKQDYRLVQHNRNHKQIFDDGQFGFGLDTFANFGLAFSMKKKQRWLIPDLLEAKILEMSCCASLEQSLVRVTGESNCILLRPEEKNKIKIQPEAATTDTIHARTVLVEKGFHRQRHYIIKNQCKTVFDSGDPERPVKKSKNWRCNLRNLLPNEDSIDVKYEVSKELGLIGWPSGAESRYQKETVYYYKAAKKGRKHRRQKKRNSIRIGQLKDDLDILCDDEDVLFTDDEDYYVLEEAEENISRKGNYTLKDFIVSKRKQPKGRVTGHQVGNLTQSQYIQYSNKNNVLSEVPEAHKLIDEMPSAQRTSSYIMTPVASIEENKVTEHLKNDSTVVVFTVGITETSLDKKTLEQEFGKAYVEGRAYPRCFAIFLSQLKQSVYMSDSIVIVAEIKNAMTRADKFRRLDAVPVEFKVFNAKSGSLKFLQEETQSKCVFDLFCVVQRITGTCLQSSTKNDVVNVRDTNYTQIPQVIQKFVKWKTRPIVESEAFDLVFDKIARTGTKSINTPRDMNFVQFEEPVCLVCYAKLSPPTPWDFGSIAAYVRSDEGAALTSCCHWLCKGCWKRYLDIKISEGSLKIECPFTNCKHAVDIVTCLSFSTDSGAAKYLQMKFESEVQKDSRLQWCPGCEKAAVCEKVEKTKTGKVLEDIPYVSCSCKTKWCFSCQGKPHWPIPCDLHSEYQALRDKEIGLLYDENGQLYQTAIEVKPCPFCKTPINKNHGCNYMACRCGSGFCWKCGKPYRGQHDKCAAQKAKTLVFSSLDEYHENYRRSNTIKKAAGYQFHIRTISKLKTKLGVEKGREPGSQPSIESSRLCLLRKAVNLQKDCCSVLECVALAKRRSTSKHFNRRLAMFFDRIDSLLNNYITTLTVPKIEDINLSILSFLIKSTEEAMSDLKYFGL